MTLAKNDKGHRSPLPKTGRVIDDPSHNIDINIDLDIDSDIDQEEFNIYGNFQNEIIDPQKLFLKIWQETGDVFNITARIESPKEWQHFWEASKTTCEQVKTGLANFIEDVRSGVIEPRFVPSTPDRFVLKGWLQKCQKRFTREHKTSPPHFPLQTSKKSL
jgi:hypothetical protein